MSTKAAIMDSGGSRRGGLAPKAGSVWESRMKFHQVTSGFKVFSVTTEENSPENSDSDSDPQVQMDKKGNDITVAKQSLTGSAGRRKTWKSDLSDGSPLQIARQISKARKNLDQDFKDSGDSNKSPVWIKKKSGDGNVKNRVHLRKVVSDSTDVVSDGKDDEGYDEPKNSDPNRKLEGSDGVMDKSPDRVGISRSGDQFVIGAVKVDLDEKDKGTAVEKKSLPRENMPKKTVIEEKILIHNNQRSVLSCSNVRKQPRFHPGQAKSMPIVTDHFEDVPRTRTHSRLQSFVELVMWKDVSKSAFVLAIGTFGIITSSYTKDLSISFISVMSYLGLVYLAAIFLFRSFVNRGTMEVDPAYQDFVVGEEEAIRVVKSCLPYANVFLLKSRALFSGDPAATMKLAVLMFILARFGSSITIWRITKFGFVGVFTVPKICTIYSSQFTTYGTAFWMGRWGDSCGWSSTSHKKAAALAILTLFLIFSSIIARIWAVFMLFVAFKYYQQPPIEDGHVQPQKTRQNLTPTVMRTE